MSEGRHVPRRRGPASRCAYYVVRALVAGFTRLWTRMAIEGREHIPRDGRLRARPGAPLEHGHADRVVPDPPPAALHGQGHAVEEPARSAWLLSSLGGFPVVAGHRRPRGAAALHRRARGRRAARAVPRGRAQVRPDRAAAVRRGRLRRPQGRRADRPGRHRRLGAGDAEGRAVHPPAQGPRHRRRSRSRRRRPAESGRVPARRSASDSDELHATLQELFDERPATRRACSRLAAGPISSDR